MPQDLEGTPVGGKGEAILNEFFTHAIRPDGYKRFRNVTLPATHSKFAERMENFEVRDDDIWVMSYPKTGTTWTQEMVWCIGNDLDFEGAKTLLPERFPFFEHSSLFDYRNVLSKNPSMKLPPFVTDSVGYLNQLPGQRFIKTHIPWKLLPSQIRNGEKTPKIVYVCRNARDTLISYYHHCILLEGYKSDLENFLQLFMDDALSFSPYWEHVGDFWHKKNLPNVLFLTYEQMKQDLAGCIRKTADFLGKKINEDQVDVLCDHLSFKSMKNNPAVNYEPVIELNRSYNLLPAEGHFMRSGTGGEWKNKLTADQTEALEDWIEKNIQKHRLQEVWTE